MLEIKKKIKIERIKGDREVVWGYQGERKTCLTWLK